VNYLPDKSAVSALMRSEARMENQLSSVGPEDNVSTCVVTQGEVLSK
jgi:predicted nucleic acid-binding protein